MNTNKRKKNDDIKIILSTLWIVILFNMIFADVVGFMSPGTLEEIISGNVGITITQELLLVFSIFLEIPILMVFLSRFLDNEFNRWANIIACILTALFVIGGGNIHLSYLFFASIEIVCMSIIVWYAWHLPKSTH